MLVHSVALRCPRWPPASADRCSGILFAHVSAYATPNASTHSVSSRLYRSREQCVVLAIWLQYFIGAFILEDKVSHNFSAKASDRAAMLVNKCSKHGTARNNKKKLGVLASSPKCFILSPSHPEPVTNTTWWWSKLSRHRVDSLSVA